MKTDPDQISNKNETQIITGNTFKFPLNENRKLFINFLNTLSKTPYQVY